MVFETSYRNMQNSGFANADGDAAAGQNKITDLLPKVNINGNDIGTARQFRDGIAQMYPLTTIDSAAAGFNFAQAIRYANNTNGNTKDYPHEFAWGAQMYQLDAKAKFPALGDAPAPSQPPIIVQQATQQPADTTNTTTAALPNNKKMWFVIGGIVVVAGIFMVIFKKEKH